MTHGYVRAAEKERGSASARLYTVGRMRPEHRILRRQGTSRALGVTSTLLCLVSIGVAVPAAAQEPGPQPCGQEAETADYGPIAVGAIVVPQRHRFIGGDPNWDDRMGRFLGRVARVVRLSGVDQEGCPGVRIDVDGGRWFWRVRDLNMGSDRPTHEPRPRASSLPQRCSEGRDNYGTVRVGSRVVLGRHRPVDGEDNWTPEMTAFVGRTATVVELAGRDEQDCMGIHVDADGRQWFWRVRDLRISGGGPDVPYRPGMASDHGRPQAPPVPPVPPDSRLPQACGATDANADFGPLAQGTAIVLGRHRAVSGEPNWIPEMEPFVGREARVTEQVGVDDQGCAIVRVDVDNGEYVWRVRDLRLPAPAEAPPPAAGAADPAPTPVPAPTGP